MSGYSNIYKLYHNTNKEKAKVQSVLNSLMIDIKPKITEINTRLIEYGSYNFYEDIDDSIFIRFSNTLQDIKEDLIFGNYTMDYNFTTIEVMKYLINNGIKIKIDQVNKDINKVFKDIRELRNEGKAKYQRYCMLSPKIASFSGGKDSAWMIIEAMNRGIKFDKIVFLDTTLEFPEMYEYIDRFEEYINQEIIRLKPKYTFDELFFKEFTKGKKEGLIRGYPYVVGQGCWVKRDLKLKQMEEFKKTLPIKYIDYIGIAYDEEERYQRVKIGEQFAPLYEWKIKEKDCLENLKKINLHNNLYDKFNRLGCYNCPKQSNNSLYSLYKHYPNIWEKMKWYESMDNKQFKPNTTLLELEKKFKNLNF